VSGYITVLGVAGRLAKTSSFAYTLISDIATLKNK
jgi:hypothetical protein